MTSGPTKIPPQQIPGQARPAKPPAQPNVLLTKLPAELAEVKKALVAKGEVIRDNRDGTLQIRTDKGDVEISIQTRDVKLQRGDHVEIEIPPGRPPKSARLTPESPSPPSSSRPAQTPVDIQVRPDTSSSDEHTPSSPVPTVLTEGQTVRLQPIPPQDALQYAIPPLETIPAHIPEAVEFSLQITAQNAQSSVLEQVVDLIAPPPLPVPALLPVTVVSATVSPGQSAPSQTIYFAVQNSITPTPVSFTAPLLQTQVSTETGLQTQIPALPAQQAGILPLPVSTPVSPVLFTLPANPNDSFITSTNNFPGLQLRAFILAPFQAKIAAINVESLSPALSPADSPPAPPQFLLQPMEKPLILQNQKAAEIPALIIGHTPQNLPVIGMISPATGEKLFFIMNIPGENIIPGTPISLLPQKLIGQLIGQLLGQPLASAQTAPLLATLTFPPLPAYFLTPEPWPVMDEIHQSLAQLLPQAARAMANITPSPANPAQLGAAALFFIAVARGGDLTQWLGGRAIDALQRGGKGGLLNRLAQEGSALSKLAAEPVSQDWRAVALPLMWDNHLHKIALHYKNDSQSGHKDEHGKQMRFIFDLSLDAMGKVQLDGLFRAKRLDLILRTQQPFSQSMQAEMRRIYSGALGETNITGELSFQNRPEQWVTITPKSGQFGIST